jgi:hypothetical protein
MAMKIGTVVMNLRSQQEVSFMIALFAQVHQTVLSELGIDLTYEQCYDEAKPLLSETFTKKKVENYKSSLESEEYVSMKQESKKKLWKISLTEKGSSLIQEHLLKFLKKEYPSNLNQNFINNNNNFSNVIQNKAMSIDLTDEKQIKDIHAPLSIVEKGEEQKRKHTPTENSTFVDDEYDFLKPISPLNKRNRIDLLPEGQRTLINNENGFRLDLTQEEHTPLINNENGKRDDDDLCPLSSSDLEFLRLGPPLDKNIRMDLDQEEKNEMKQNIEDDDLSTICSSEDEN